MGLSIVGWACLPFGRRVGLGLQGIDGAALAGVFNMGASSVANCVSVLERAR